MAATAPGDDGVPRSRAVAGGPAGPAAAGPIFGQKKKKKKKRELTDVSMQYSSGCPPGTIEGDVCLILLGTSLDFRTLSHTCNYAPAYAKCPSPFLITSSCNEG